MNCLTDPAQHSATLVSGAEQRVCSIVVPKGMALAGHNSIVAPTGQEEVQYKVLTSPQFGLTDMQVRNWTNGPAFLTWSRGQNSHGVSTECV